MRLCISQRSIDPHATGVARYGRVLLAAAHTAGMVPLMLEEEPVSTRGAPMRRLAAALPSKRRLSRTAAGFHRTDIYREAQVRFRKFGRMVTLAAPGPPGIMHWTYPLPMRIAGWRNIYTVHDVIPLNPDLASPVDGARLRRLLHVLAGSADRLVTVSEEARADLLAELGCADAFVKNLGQAVDMVPDRETPLPAGLHAGGFFLFAGVVEHRKNLPRLVEAHALSGTSLPLVIAGPDGAGSEALAPAIAANPLVIRMPFQPRETLVRLLASARALLFPSLAEGFGLPIAEAMTLGTPVMTARGGATEEVSGGAALLVDPLDVAGMARAIAALDTDAALRGQLAARGLERAAAFTLPAYGDRLRRFYETLPHG